MAAKTNTRRKQQSRGKRKAGKKARTVAKKKAPRRKSTKATRTRAKARPKPKARKAKAVRQKPRKSRPARAARKPAPSKRKPAKPTAQAAAPKPNNGRNRTLGKPSLDRTRRVLSDDERFEGLRGPAGASTERMARSGHDHLRAELERHTETGPRLTAGDVDAKWQDAYAVGDEAPGGDNPTPDQDRVDDIGRALGIQYQDDQELQGGDEVAERDKHRWELDPASSDDWPHKDEEEN